ncbi:hypothetical protein [Streptomyces vinaceus]|uniref:hypothetical protein n=1 Tax=Streptomyces vinaceus TaxID=1960 RepID=UPI0035D849F3
MQKRTTALAALAPALALLLSAAPAQAAPANEIIGYPGPDGLIWIADQAGSSGFVSGGLSPDLGGFGAWVTASTPTTHWGATVTQPE